MIKSAQALEMYQGSKDDEDYVMSKSASRTATRAVPPRWPLAAPHANGPARTDASVPARCRFRHSDVRHDEVGGGADAEADQPAHAGAPGLRRALPLPPPPPQHLRWVASVSDARDYPSRQVFGMLYKEGARRKALQVRSSAVPLLSAFGHATARRSLRRGRASCSCASG
jgi:hypothetical protein